MLRHGKVASRLPAQDLDRARAFYAEKLGLEPVEEPESALRYVGAQGEFALFASAGAGSGDHTQMGWEVDDIEATVREMRGRGVVFEEYDLPGLTTDKYLRRHRSVVEAATAVAGMRRTTKVARAPVRNDLARRPRAPSETSSLVIGIPPNSSLSPTSGPCAVPEQEARAARAREGPGEEIAPCLAEVKRLGYRQQVTYQPSSRFWRLQGYETAIYTALTLGLAGFCSGGSATASPSTTKKPTSHACPTRGRSMRAIILVTSLAIALSASPAAADTGLHLPGPTGPRPVGVTTLYLKDTARSDPWVPSVNYRELMVSFFYPAASSKGAKKQYMTPLESERYLERQNIPDLPLDVLSTVRTNAVLDARPAGRRHPLIVLSPGFTNSRATLSALAEDLASHGYVVAVVDHTYENRATTFPDGRVTDCAACEVDDLPGFWEKLVQSRAADVSFVLDELVGPHSGACRGANLIDPSRIAMGGHSAGGASTIHAMLADSRIRAGIDIDGSTHVPIPDPGLSRPFMFVGSMDSYTPGAPGPYDGWEDDWQQMSGWKRWIMVTGTVHQSFTDLGVFAGQLGIDIGATIDANRALAITRAYTRAFFDRHLRSKPRPLMTAPSPRYPEVTFIG